MYKAKSAIHPAVAPFLRIGVISIAAVVPAVIRLAHVVRCFLTFFQVHITETRLQRLGTDRENQNKNKEFHDIKIN